MRLFRNSLGWRLYAVGVVQLVLVALAAILIGYVLARVPEHEDVRHVAIRLAPFTRDPGALAGELRQIRKRHELQLSVYDAKGNLVATNVEPPLPAPRWGSEPGGPPRGGEPPPFDGPPHHFGGPPPPPPLGPFGPLFGPPPGGPDHGPAGGPGAHPHGPPPDMYAKLDVAGGEGVLVARMPHPRPSPLPPLLTLVSGLVVVGAGAFLTTRWISRPLAELSRAARALGHGDLAARTDLKRPDELGEVGRAFDEMAARMSELVLSEKELLANVSHELRTPLARIRVALEIAGEGDPETVRASLAEIAVDLAELESLIDDVLAATRLAVTSRTAQPSGFSLHREEVAPGSICERAAERFGARYPGRPFECDVAPDLPVLLADPALLRRVVDNLLENAHKYSAAPDDPVTLRARARGAEVVFEVTDQGIGIPEEDLPRIFDPFFRGERSRSRGTGGVGLGLTLVKRIVDAHGGTVSVESAKSRGTTVRAAIPVASRGEAPRS